MLLNKIEEIKLNLSLLLDSLNQPLFDSAKATVNKLSVLFLEVNSLLEKHFKSVKNKITNTEFQRLCDEFNLINHLIIHVFNENSENKLDFIINKCHGLTKNFKKYADNVSSNIPYIDEELLNHHPGVIDIGIEGWFEVFYNLVNECKTISELINNINNFKLVEKTKYGQLKTHAFKKIIAERARQVDWTYEDEEQLLTSPFFMEAYCSNPKYVDHKEMVDLMSEAVNDRSFALIKAVFLGCQWQFKNKLMPIDQSIFNEPIKQLLWSCVALPDADQELIKLAKQIEEMMASADVPVLDENYIIEMRVSSVSYLMLKGFFKNKFSKMAILKKMKDQLDSILHENIEEDFFPGHGAIINILRILLNQDVLLSNQDRQYFFELLLPDDNFMGSAQTRKNIVDFLMDLSSSLLVSDSIKRSHMLRALIFSMKIQDVKATKYFINIFLDENLLLEDMKSLMSSLNPFSDFIKKTKELSYCNDNLRFIAILTMLLSKDQAKPIAAVMVGFIRYAKDKLTEAPKDLMQDFINSYKHSEQDLLAILDTRIDQQSYFPVTYKEIFANYCPDIDIYLASEEALNINILS